MPPFVTRKRERSASPLPTPPAKKQAVAKPKAKAGNKPTLFDAADNLERKPGSSERAKKLLSNLDHDDDESSLSEADSDDFEDVPPSKRRKTADAEAEDGEDDGEDEDDEMQWEDAIQDQTKAGPSARDDDGDIADVSIQINDDGTYIEPVVSGATGKKGPSKRERLVRVQTHCLHVQALMWHNTVRNSWLNDKEVQTTLVEGLTEGVKREVLRWKDAMGTLTKEELAAKKKAAAVKNRGKAKGRKGKGSVAGRDWSYNADHLEQGVPDLSHGDPLLRLLKVLTGYWRKRFTITSPGLRKQGYMPLRMLRDEVEGWKKDHNDYEEHGERIENLAEFRKLARDYEGSRDVGEQLFVALLRGLSLDTRMVANLQPAGIGWSKAEEAEPKRPRWKKSKAEKEELPSEEDVEVEKSSTPKSSKKSATPKIPKQPMKEKPTRKSSRGNKAEPINLDDSDSPLSSPPFENDEPPEVDSDDESIVDVTPAAPKRIPNKKYDRDMGFPVYWAEVKSPVSNKFIPVDPIVLSTIASNEELLGSFEPRGKRAEMSKQVICYIIGFNPDGTAKDVTVRYLKKHQLPGKTKGMRLPAEKIPIYNRKGKVKRYEHYDWFRTLMSLYDKPEANRTAADDLEEQTDLKPFKPAATGSKEPEKESLQWYKQSADYVLEQHLRREEALLPDAKPVRTFTAGKGEKAKDHPVYRRDDVVVCKTVESWHKEGREVKFGEKPMKHVPVRAVTLMRKREMEDAQRETGEKLKQGLFAVEQTDWIIPPPIQDGKIPKNAYGNMDVYVPTMVPEGAVHVPLKGSAKLCRRLGIDYAEACTGFEFGKQRAVPVLTGVVVAKGNERAVRDAWKVEQAEVKRKEDTKRTGAALNWWRKMVIGLRIVERMKIEYASSDGKGVDFNPFVNRAIHNGKAEVGDGGFAAKEEDMAGGFFQPGHEEEEVPQRRAQDSMGGGGFFMGDEEDDTAGGGGFLVEDDTAEPAAPEPDGHQPVKPKSLQAMHQSDGPSDEPDLEPSPKDDNVDDAEEEPPKAARPAPKSRRQPKPAAKPKPKPSPPARTRTPARRKVPVSIPSDSSPPGTESEDDNDDDSEDKASVSDLSDVSSTIGDSASPKKAASPKVVVTPRKAKAAVSAAGRETRARNGKGSKRKTTPLKSPYFSSQGQEDEASEEEEEGSEEEVVKPRATTARTRARR